MTAALPKMEMLFSLCSNEKSIFIEQCCKNNLPKLLKARVFKIFVHVQICADSDFLRTISENTYKLKFTCVKYRTLIL